MPIPWLVVLQSVPWTDAIRNAPKVAEGARKLWNTVAKKKPESEPPTSEAESLTSVDSKDIAVLEARIASLEAATAELHAQMLASSELIKALAEQNTQLVERVEAHRMRLVWVAGFAAALAIALIANVAWVR